MPCRIMTFTVALVGALVTIIAGSGDILPPFTNTSSATDLQVFEIGDSVTDLQAFVAEQQPDDDTRLPLFLFIAALFLFFNGMTSVGSCNKKKKKATTETTAMTTAATAATTTTTTTIGDVAEDNDLYFYYVWKKNNEKYFENNGFGSQDDILS
mmetsp:Transcript_51430/g.124174  ORF Transcript_51430/g.124174 Transcript_51430/m.124174 type:complete len:154 (-) Transcript_51430:54-515(-)